MQAGLRVERPSVIAYNPYVWDDLDYTYFGFPWSWYEYAYEPYFYPIKSDTQIKNDVERELWWSPFVNSNEIKVSVKNGVVTLTGTVETQFERQVALENAVEGGALWVNNKLNVK